MSRNTKIILVVMALSMVCGCGGGALIAALQAASQALKQSMVTSPAEVAAMAHEVADYDLPAGYREQFGIKLLNITMVGLTNDSSNSLIMLTQYPASVGLDRAAMEQQMQQALQRQLDSRSLRLTPVGYAKATIRGDKVTLTVREGPNPQGQRFRQLSGVFQGKGGLALLMVLGPVAAWDQSAVDTFLASLR